MEQSILKLAVSDDKMTLEIYETEPGKLIIDLFSVDPENNLSGGSISVNTESFMTSLKKLLEK